MARVPLYWGESRDVIGWCEVDADGALEEFGITEPSVAAALGLFHGTFGAASDDQSSSDAQTAPVSEAPKLSPGGQSSSADTQSRSAAGGHP